MSALLLVLDLAGTFVFALSGASRPALRGHPAGVQLPVAGANGTGSR